MSRHARRMRRARADLAAGRPVLNPIPVTDDGAPPCPHCSGNLGWFTQAEMVDLMVDLGRPPIEMPAGTRLLPMPHPWWFCWDCGAGGALIDLGPPSDRVEAPARR